MKILEVEEEKQNGYYLLHDKNKLIEIENYRLKHNDSLEFLELVHASPLRKSNLIIATFNLVTMIVGRGVLSLLLAFEK